MSTETAPEVVTNDGGQQPSSWPWVRISKKLAGKQRFGRTPALILLAVIIVIGGFLIYKKVTNHNITIGKTVITPAAIQELANEISVYSKNAHVSFNGSPKHVAGDDLVLNAALKDQAAKHGIKVTQADIDAANAQQYRIHGGSRASYQRYVKAANIASLTTVTNENNVYQTKLNDVVIAKKDLFVLAINYDAPYFDTAQNPATLRAQATKIMQTKFLPLFKANLSEPQIAAKADVNYTQVNPNPNQSIFFTGMPVTAFYVRNCTTSTPCFNDAEVGRFASIPGIVSTETKIAQLTQVGQYTDVFTSKAGFIGILQLSSETPGAYNSWNQLLQQYRHKYAPKLALSNSAINRIAAVRDPEATTSKTEIG